MSTAFSAVPAPFEKSPSPRLVTTQHPGPGPNTLVGDTPVLWVGEPFADGGKGFWAKLEGSNPGGMKDRPALHMVEQATARGDLAPGAMIIESTSGTLGLGLALAGTVHGHPVTLVTDPGMEPIVQRMLAAYGARIELVTEPHPTGGWQQARLDKVHELLAAHPGSWCPDQYNNPDNVAAYESLAVELIAQLGRMDVLVCSVGTGGHSAGIARVLRQYFPHLALIGVDTIGSTIFGQPADTRIMRGLGSSIYPDNIDYPAFDEVHWIAPAEAVWACRTLTSTYHASGGWSVGAVALAAGWTAREPRGHPHRRGLPGRTAAILRHHLQRRLLPRARTSRRGSAHRTDHHRPSHRPRRTDLDEVRQRRGSQRGQRMRALITQFRSFDRPSQVLMVNQFSINLGFYMLMPFLAGYLAGPLGLAAWTIGLVLGLRNVSQQGMFLVGGTLADRLGYKPLIVAGCLLRTGGFVLLAVVDSLPAILLASVATGFAGALFNPAVRAYLAADAGPRRVEAFAVFNVFYQAGILLGPLVGLALTTVDFRVTALVAAGVFGVLTVVQIWALPPHEADSNGAPTTVLEDWRVVVSHRPFVLFSLAMIGSYVLSFQIYLALPLQADLVAGGASATALVTSLFVVSGLVAIVGQLRITAWFSGRWGSGRSVVIGMVILSTAFVPLVLVPTSAVLGSAPAAAALLLTAALLAVGTAAVFPFEMDTVVALAGGKLVATHYGFYNTVVGIGILLCNLGTGAVFGLLHGAHLDSLIWIALTTLGLSCVTALYLLDRSGSLTPPSVTVATPDSE